MTIAELLKQTKLAQNIHVKWAKIQQDRIDQGKRILPNAGDAVWHKRWIKYYKEIAKQLKEKQFIDNQQL